MWLAKNQIAMPTQIQLAHIIDDVIKAKADATLNCNSENILFAVINNVSI